MLRYVYYLIPLALVIHLSGLMFYNIDLCASYIPIFVPCMCMIAIHFIFLKLVTTPLRMQPIHDSEKNCSRCGAHRTKTSKHCSICDMCVDGFDHHCDVLEICVGRQNIAWFRAFLISNTAFCAYGAFKHIDTVRCTFRNGLMIPHLMYTFLFVLELSFAVTFGIFALFHCTLWACGSTTYSLIITCRRWLTHVQGWSRV